MKPIKVSPKHGLNPSLSACFWCGKDKNELILMGRLPDDKEAPRRAVFDYEPCDTCKAQMEQGITLIEASDRDNGNAEIQRGVFPTGRWAVITEEAARRLLQPESMVEAVLKHRKAFLDSESWQKLGLTEEQD